jgi:diguanylate cyclase (GGDEF)-like protein/PAS domain S-box-containing protein
MLLYIKVIKEADMQNSNDIQTFNDGILDSDEKFQALVENSVAGIYIIKDGKFSYINQRLADIFEYEREELLGMSHLDLTHEDDKLKATIHIQKRLSGIEKSKEYTFKGVTKSNKIKYIHVFGSAINYEGKQAIIGSLIDETEAVLANQKLEELASYDTLTTLYNRHIFETELQRTEQHALRSKSKFALIVFDIDNFKRFNDSLGHHVGDLILQKIAKRLKKIVRSTNLLARIGGDEFAIIVENFHDKSEIAALTKRLKKMMKQSINVDQHTLHVSFSIGVAFFPEHAQDSATLQKLADAALYEVKSFRKNDCAVYSKDKDKIRKNIQLEDELYRAITNNEFVSYLQPQIDLKTKKVVAAEALIRWNHPNRGMLFPADFLSLANEIGILYKMDLLMIENAFKTLNRWKRKEISISVNISNSLFHYHKFLQKIEQLCKKYPDVCNFIELEITEDIIINSKSYADEILSQLKKLGFRLSIDDFGTGYSSLSHLKTLNIDKLKIDRLFIKDLAKDANDVAITKAIIAMGHALNLTVIAEGAEEKEQITILEDMECDLAQCFYFSEPLPIEVFEKLWL